METALVTTENQFVQFAVGGETLVVEISKVLEVLDVTAITRIPKTPPCVLGIINLRGSAVPVTDLLTKFELKERKFPVEQSCVIITELYHGGKKKAVGMLVDAVQDVIVLPQNSIKPTPQMGTAIPPKYLKGMGTKGQESGYVMILNIEKVFE